MVAISFVEPFRQGDRKQRMNNLLKDVPVGWGPRFEFGNAAVTYTRVDPNVIEFEAPAHMALVMFSPQPGREVALGTDRRSTFLAPAGSVEIIPASAELFARWTTPKENLLVALEPCRLARLAQSEFDRANLDLQPPREGYIDRKALFIAEMIRDELVSDLIANPIYLDSLVTIFSIHLLRNYSSSVGWPTTVHRGGLSARSWREVSDYIDANLKGDLCIETLAAVTQLSPSHFLRAFRQTVGQPPHRYILERRLSLGEKLVVSTDMSLADIAVSCGFSSHSHFSSAMRRWRNMRPSELRREARKPRNGLR